MSVTKTKSKYPQWKTDSINEISELIKSNNTTAFCKLHKVRAAQLMQLRKNFKNDLTIRVVKNTLSKRGIADSKVDNSEKLVDAVTEQKAFIFTDMDPFKLFLLLEKGKVDLPARDGDIASGEITVPSGNTGMQPGPDLSAFKEFNIPTRINAGSIFVSQDTVVAKEGDSIKSSLAALLTKLDIKPIKAGVAIDLAYMDGLIYPAKDVAIDLNEYRSHLIQSFNNALNLALNEEYLTKETVPLLLAKAFTNSKNISIESDYMTKETVSHILSKKHLEAETLSKLVN
ncbi:MAG: 50S ribosomal protein L10 [Thaumarchaeota archaeon]|nr:50S ribosomal protein L10 [Nitrososphaerota archaeon]|tara:strand:- start:7506 stop:8363 length:858 start_codon:yes stop_codon:yes gene_type:complete